MRKKLILGHAPTKTDPEDRVMDHIKKKTKTTFIPKKEEKLEFLPDNKPAPRVELTTHQVHKRAKAKRNPNASGNYSQDRTSSQERRSSRTSGNYSQDRTSSQERRNPRSSGNYSQDRTSTQERRSPRSSGNYSQDRTSTQERRSPRSSGSYSQDRTSTQERRSPRSSGNYSQDRTSTQERRSPRSSGNYSQDRTSTQERRSPRSSGSYSQDRTSTQERRSPRSSGSYSQDRTSTQERRSPRSSGSYSQDRTSTQERRNPRSSGNYSQDRTSTPSKPFRHKSRENENTHYSSSPHGDDQNRFAKTPRHHKKPGRFASSDTTFTKYMTSSPKQDEFSRYPKKPRATNSNHSGYQTEMTGHLYGRQSDSGDRFTTRPARKPKHQTENKQDLPRTRGLRRRTKTPKDFSHHHDALQKDHFDSKSDQSEKIQKVLAAAGLSSRREIEEWIVSGRIKVNNEVATLGQRVTPEDKISVDDRVIEREHTDNKTRVLLYHKPGNEICSRKDPEGRATVFDNLPKLRHSRWIMVGRLDFNTSGVLLFTTNGELAKRLMHPSYGLEREYAVRVLGDVSEEILSKLQEGVMLEDGIAKFEEIKDAGGSGANHWYHVILREGKNREVRRLWESQGITVSRLIRIRYGAISLPRNLQFGRYEELSPEEVTKLQDAVGIKSPSFQKTKYVNPKFQSE